MRCGEGNEERREWEHRQVVVSSENDEDDHQVVIAHSAYLFTRILPSIIQH